ncbi:Vps62-related protein [Streptomyces gamaensis]|uniref:Vps62-related protein n=1 Tax=Streptomyces gamaensis TaxID=1763542 RepID=A0ABW0Z6W6_9ACTN
MLGTLWSELGTDPRQRLGALVLKDVSGSDLLRPPVDYERVWTSAYQGAYTIWRPRPPEGCVALGDFFQLGSGKPELTAVTCVKKTHRGHDYVRRAVTGRESLRGMNDAWFGIMCAWGVEVPLYPSGDTNEHLYVPAGLFTVARGMDRPVETDVSWILDLPAAVEKGPDPELPRLTSHDEPPPTTTMVTDRRVTVPYSMVKDDGVDELWKISNLPFYKIQRNRHYELILWRNNRDGSEPQPDSEAVTTGVSRTQGESFSRTTGITVGVTVGVEASAKLFGSGTTTTVQTSVSTTLEVGYERRYDITTMEERTVTRTLVTPPRSSGALWMERHELLPIRANGDLLSPTAKLPFRTVYYHTGQYPPASETGVEVRYEELDVNGDPVPENLRIGIPAQDEDEAKPDETITA